MTLKEWAAWLLIELNGAELMFGQRGVGLNADTVTQLTTDLEIAQAEHERELADLRERCAEAVYGTLGDAAAQDEVRAVPLRRPREGE